MLTTTSSDTIYISSKQQSESNQTNDDESTSILTDFLNLVPVNPLLEEKLDAGTGPRQEWHVGPEKRVMTIEQEDLPGCGGKTWEAADILIDYMTYTHSKNEFTYSTILELGSGTGLVGIAAAILAHSSISASSSGICGCILLSDLENLVPLMSRNAFKNLTTSELSLVKIVPYDWFLPPPAQLQVYMPIDLILISDCVYLELLFEPLIKSLVSLCQLSLRVHSSHTSTHHSPEIWISYKRRRRANRIFWKRFEKFFDLDLVTDHPDYPAYSRNRLALYKARWKGIPYFDPCLRKAIQADHSTKEE